MNILVTGGKGQLGLSLKKISINYPQHRFVFTDLPEADITNALDIKEMIEREDIDAIVNCAAYTAVDKAESEPEIAAKVNVEGPQNLAGLAAEYNIPLVHISTDYVFDGMSKIPLTECDEPNPTGVYGKTKLEGEKIIESKGINAAIIRTSWLYSEFGNNFVKTMLRLADSHKEINVVCDQIGSPTYAPDLALFIMYLLERGIAGTEIYHYSNLGEISWYEFAVEIFKMAGKDVKVNAISTSMYPTPAKRPAYSVMDKSKALSLSIDIPEWRNSLETCLEELLK